MPVLRLEAAGLNALTMGKSWKLSAAASRKRVQTALLAHEDALDWDWDIVLCGREVADDRPEEWILEAYMPRKPTAADRVAVSQLFTGRAPKLVAEELPDEDWVTLSQGGVEPIRAGRFYVHTPEYPHLAGTGLTNFVIPASQAFGTGQHETTAGCLAMQDTMKRTGVIARNVADIGTGTGLLAFAALALWPRALATASDIDDVCIDVVERNATQNGVTMGAGPGSLTMLVADGMDHPVLQARAPYDLLIANILAGPLVELAQDFGRAVLPGGNLLLAGLLTTQEQAIRKAYRMAGFRLARRMTNGDWSILWLRRRPGAPLRATQPRKLPQWARKW